MKLYFGALAGVLSFYSLQAQEISQNIVDPVKAAEEAQRQAQFAYENQLSELNNAANQAKEGLLSRRTALNRELQQCFIQNNEAGINAQQQADQQTQQATNQLIQGAQQGLTPLLQNFGTANSMGKAEAVAQKREAIKIQNDAATKFITACGANFGTSVRIDQEGKNATRIKYTAQNAMNGVGADPTHSTTNPQCKGAASTLLSTTQEAEDMIREEKQATAASSSNTMSYVAAALAVGANIYGYNQGKNAAESGLEDANRMNAMSYDACQQGVKDEAAELDRQLANIDKQLAEDRARLAKQFAQFKLNIPANLQDKGFIDEGDDGLPTIGKLGGAVAGTQFKGPENPFGNLLNKNGGGDGTGGGGGAAGSGGGGSGGDGNVGWGFRDPYETNNPGLAYTLPLQPEKAGLIGGADGGEFGGGGANPFDGFMGFDDPFGNLGGQGELALAEGQGGNGFIELALKTRRRVYAHLNELLGKPVGTKVSKEEKKDPERKISSARE